MEYTLRYSYAVVDEMVLTADSVHEAIAKFEKYTVDCPKDFGRHISKPTFSDVEIVGVSKKE